MEKFVISRSDALADYEKGVTCCQKVLTHWADLLGYDDDELMNMGAAFGGGMGIGETCGAVTGALMAIGLMYGVENAGNRELVIKKSEEFIDRFSAEFGFTMCRELLGADARNEEEWEKAVNEGRLIERCPLYMAGAINILDDLFNG